MKPYISKNHTKAKGFTLVEMIIAIGIFSVAMVMGVAAVVSIVNANRVSQSQSLIFSNLSIAIEGMTKAIRVGTGYSQSDGTAGITFIPSSGVGTVKYLFSEQKIIRYVYDDEGIEVSENDVTPDTGEIIVDNLSFNVDTSNEQPKVLIRLKGHSGVRAGSIKYFYLQSLVSQRLLDL
ncbi:MAG: type II secretion system protein [Patescibacteria group bacterium]